MAKKDSDDLLVFLGVATVVAIGYAWLTSGRGQNNSPLIPDRLEDQIDLVVEELNKEFGHQWVTYRLNDLQSHIERTWPQLTAWVRLLLLAEQAYSHISKAGSAKKQYALQMARRG
jgi:hypothetical protein